MRRCLDCCPNSSMDKKKGKKNTYELMSWERGEAQDGDHSGQGAKTEKAQP